MSVTLRLVVGCLACAAIASSARAQEPADRVTVRVTGTVLLNLFSTSSKTNNFDVPQIVTPRTAADSLGDGGGLGMTVRQTRLGVRALWPELYGAEVRAEVDADFYGGQQQSAFGDLAPLFRVRRAVVDAVWNRASLLVGQEVPLIAEHNPVSLASVGLSGLASSGNLWLWLPQIRAGVGVVRRPRVRLDIEGAVMATATNQPSGEFLTQPDRAESTNRPAVQARAVLRWGGSERPSDISLGFHRGWLATTGDSLLASRAVAAAARLSLGPRLTVLAEAFDGRALAGLGGGGVSQLLGLGGRPVRTRGGWGQLQLQLPRSVTLSAGGGVDDPSDAVLAAGDRLRNATAMGAIHWTPAPFVSGLEVRRLTTTYTTGALSATHVNLALGVAF